MKSVYEIAEIMLKTHKTLSEIEDITGLFRDVLIKIDKKQILTVLIEKVSKSIEEVEEFLADNHATRHPYRYDGSLSPKAIELMKKLKEVLEFEKALLPFPTEEKKETELSPREKEMRELDKKLPKIRDVI